MMSERYFNSHSVERFRIFFLLSWRVIVKNYFLGKNRLVQSLSMAALLSLSVSVMSEDAPAASSKIAVVDVRIAVLQTELAQSQFAELKKQDDFKNNMESIESLEVELKAMVETYQKDRAVMSAQKREEEEKRIVEKQKDRNYIASKLQQAQKDWAEQSMESQAQNLTRVLQNLVDEQGIGMLIRADTGVVLHADSSFDISAQVTERLNQIK